MAGRKVLDGNRVLQLRAENPGMTWKELGRFMALADWRVSKDGQVIPYQERALRNAIKRVTHTQERKDGR